MDVMATEAEQQPLTAVASPSIKDLEDAKDPEEMALDVPKVNLGSKSPSQVKFIVPEDGDDSVPANPSPTKSATGSDYGKSIRNADTRSIHDMQLNRKSFASYADPDEMMWGGSYYDLANDPQAMGADSNHKSLQFRPDMNKSEIFNVDEEKAAEDIDKVEPAERSKYGTWDGVFTSCLLNIFGVIMFLRLPWVVGQAGVPAALAIIGLSGVVVLLTTLSMSAIATNGKIEEGGAYFMISRSLGPEIGGAAGSLFSVGMSVAVSMYVIGFCETLVASGVTITGDFLNDVRITGFITLTICLIMVLIGIGWVIKLQLLLLGLLTCAIISFFIGAFANKQQESLPFAEGWVDGTFAENMAPEYRPFEGMEYNFFTVFGIFFPAVTGIMAGANISGDLENPSVNIPRGTLWAVGISMITYGIMAIFCGAIAERGEVGGTTGLHNDILIMEKMSVWGPLVLAGIYAATFTSALASLVGAPRILLMLAKDNLLKFLKPFSVTDKSGNPIRGYFVCFIIAGMCVAIGRLNAVAPLITMFFMITYALINYSVFVLSIGNAPGWRPSFKYYHWSTALAGALLCTGIMFMTDYVFAFAAMVIAYGICKYIELSDGTPNWGSAQEAQQQTAAISAMMKLRKVKRHVKNYRPSYLVMVGEPRERPHLVFLGNVLRQCSNTLVIFSQVKVTPIKAGPIGVAASSSYLSPVKFTMGSSFGSPSRGMPSFTSENQIRLSVDYGGMYETHHKGYLNANWRAIPGVEMPKSSKENEKGFFDKVYATSLRAGHAMLSQLSGLGMLRPNVVVMGFKDDWMSIRNKHREDMGEAAGDCEEVVEYVGMIQDTFDMRMGIIIGRDMQRIDWEGKKKSAVFDFENGVGTIDVWWLCDDGGLTALVAELLSSHAIFKSAQKKRLMLVVESEHNWTEPLVVIQQMIQRFRLNMEVVPVPTNSKGPAKRNVSLFEEIAGKKLSEFHKPTVTSRHIRIGELMRQESSKAKMCILTLPSPSNTVPEEYMATLEWLSMMLPPTILMRGANQNVLTYYL